MSYRTTSIIPRAKPTHSLSWSCFHIQVRPQMERGEPLASSNGTPKPVVCKPTDMGHLNPDTVQDSEKSGRDTDYVDVVQQLKRSYMHSIVLSLITFPFVLNSVRWLNSQPTYGSLILPGLGIPSQVDVSRVTNLVLYTHVNHSFLSSAFSESIRFTMTMLICFCINLFIGVSALSQRLWLIQEYHQSNRGNFKDKLRQRRLTISIYHFLQTLAILLLAGSVCSALFDFLDM